MLDQSAFDQQVDFAFNNDEHRLTAGITFLEYGLARRNCKGVRFVAENINVTTRLPPAPAAQI